MYIYIYIYVNKYKINKNNKNIYIYIYIHNTANIIEKGDPTACLTRRHLVASRA